VSCEAVNVQKRNGMGGGGVLGARVFLLLLSLPSLIQSRTHTHSPPSRASASSFCCHYPRPTSFLSAISYCTQSVKNTTTILWWLVSAAAHLLPSLPPHEASV
jgi:hypothetical protein